SLRAHRCGSPGDRDRGGRSRTRDDNRRGHEASGGRKVGSTVMLAEVAVSGKDEPMRMQGKVAIVTGGGSGIGRATAILCAAEGASVACVDRVEAAARETAKIVESTGGQAMALTADVTDAASCAQMVEATL